MDLFLSADPLVAIFVVDHIPSINILMRHHTDKCTEANELFLDTLPKEIVIGGSICC
jgi:hypothetical protein